jgi:hypothetical protein
MGTSGKRALIGSVVTAIGAIAAALIDSSPATVSISSAVPNGGLVVQGNGSEVTGNTIIKDSYNTIVYGNAEGELSRNVASPLVGKWKGVSRYVVPEGELISTGHSEFLKTGGYNFSGEFALRNVEKYGPDVTIVSRVVAAGTWHITGSKYSITLADVKTVRTLLRQPGKADVDLDNVASFVPGASRFRLLEDITPRGTSQEYSVVKLAATSLHATGQDLAGNGVDYVATRVQ